MKLNDRENESLGLVERVKNLVLRHSDRVRAPDAALNFQESQLSRSCHAAFDVIAEFLKLTINRLKAQTTLDLHDDCAGAGSTCLGICRTRWRASLLSGHVSDQTDGN